MIYKEYYLQCYAKPIGKTENEKCKHTIEMIRDALSDYISDPEGISLTEDSNSYFLNMTRRSNSSEKIHILIQGAYANNTNIKEDSDVDVAIIMEHPFFCKYRTDVKASMYGFVDSNRNLKDFKDEIEKALKDKFKFGVKRGNKSIKLNGNTYRVDADVVPCGRFRDYRSDFYFNKNNYIRGIQLEPDDGGIIINYPEQHILNGISKNKRTNFAFKKVVRIMKHIRGNMESYYDSAKKVGSFQLESLIWNIPSDVFEKYGILRYAFGEIVSYLYKNQDKFPTFKEVNNIKPLFPRIGDVNLYKTFVVDLKKHYEYKIQE